MTQNAARALIARVRYWNQPAAPARLGEACGVLGLSYIPWLDKVMRLDDEKALGEWWSGFRKGRRECEGKKRATWRR